MTNYFPILETENLPKSLKSKPKWLICLICTITIIVMIISAVALGVFIGYTFCYVEHQTGLRTGNTTQPENLQIQRVQKDSPEERYKRTINGALKSVLISRILEIGKIWESDDDNEVNSTMKTDVIIKQTLNI